MSAGPVIESYQWAGGREAMLRFGPRDGPVVVLALPLFEEANRTRAFGVGILRALAARGIGGVLPEMPGQGESEVPTERATLTDLRTAVAAVAGTHVVAIRSGALLADARPCWMLAPQDGPAVVRELARVKGGALDGEWVEVAGNMLSSKFFAELSNTPLPGGGRGPDAHVPIGEDGTQQLSPSHLGPGLRRGRGRVVRLASAQRPADRHVDGPALWRRAEPDNDFALVELLADDIAEWIAACAG